MCQSSLGGDLNVGKKALSGSEGSTFQVDRTKSQGPGKDMNLMCLRKESRVGG